MNLKAINDDGRKILSEHDNFRFGCHPGVSCFTRCCHDADMYLYPYDIIRIKNRLKVSSDQFLKKGTITAYRDNPFFPSVMLKMSNRQGKPCQFLGEKGCEIYEDRPFSCRAYPIEPAVSRNQDSTRCTFYFLAEHKHCIGHKEPVYWSVSDWIEDQGLAPFTSMNENWVDMDTLFRKNPWGPQGLNSKALKMAFMAAYNTDTFRNFVFESSFLKRFRIRSERLEQVKESDESLMLLGFDWIKFFLTGKGPLAEHSGL